MHQRQNYIQRMPRSLLNILCHTVWKANMKILASLFNWFDLTTLTPFQSLLIATDLSNIDFQLADYLVSGQLIDSTTKKTSDSACNNIHRNIYSYNCIFREILVADYLKKLF